MFQYMWCKITITVTTTLDCLIPLTFLSVTRYKPILALIEYTSTYWCNVTNVKANLNQQQQLEYLSYGTLQYS